MQVGSLVRSNVDNQIGIVTEVRPSILDWLPKYRVVMHNDGEMWLSSQVLEVICK